MNITPISVYIKNILQSKYDGWVLGKWLYPDVREFNETS